MHKIALILLMFTAWLPHARAMEEWHVVDARGPKVSRLRTVYRVKKPAETKEQVAGSEKKNKKLDLEERFNDTQRGKLEKAFPVMKTHQIQRQITLLINLPLNEKRQPALFLAILDDSAATKQLRMRLRQSEVLEPLVHCQVQNLLASNAWHGWKDRDGNTALHHAARLCLPEVVTVLLDGGAKPNAQNKQKETALHLVAARYGSNSPESIATVEQLRNHGARTNIRDASGNIPLHAAALWGNGKLVPLLASTIADLETHNTAGYRAIDVVLANCPRTRGELQRFWQQKKRACTTTS